MALPSDGIAATTRAEILRLANEANLSADQIATSVGLSVKEVQSVLLEALGKLKRRKLRRVATQKAPQDIEKQIAALWRTGYKPDDIADQLGHTVESVRQHVLRLQAIDALRMRQDGVSYGEIARVLQIPGGAEQAKTLAMGELEEFEREALDSAARQRALLLSRSDRLYNALSRHLDDPRPDPFAVKEMRQLLQEQAKLQGLYPRDGGLLEQGLAAVLAQLASKPGALTKLRDLFLRRGAAGDANALKLAGAITGKIPEGEVIDDEEPGRGDEQRAILALPEEDLAEIQQSNMAKLIDETEKK